MVEFDPRFVDVLRKEIAQLRNSGALPTEAKLKEYCRNFASRFGPERLSAVNGEPLLRLMHQGQSANSLLHWLESRNDESPKGFGHIVGDSAAAYGVYQLGGTWFKEGVGGEQEITLHEAVSLAELQRDELLRGCDLLRSLRPDADDEDYAKLDAEMVRAAQSVSPTVWGHRYFSLIFPERLDHFHNPVHQRFHLIKSLQLPPEERGRYAAAGRFVALARALDVPMSHLTIALNHRNGRPHAYWRVSVAEEGGAKGAWQLMQKHSCAAMGWPAVGNLAWLLDDPANEYGLTRLLEQHYSSNPRMLANVRRQIVNFVVRAAEGDIVVAADGRGNHGIGRIKGDYVFGADAAFPHQRQVEWMNVDSWPMPEPEALRTTFWQLMNEVNFIEIERRVAGLSSAPIVPAQGVAAIPPVMSRIRAALARQGQVILHGPPGTGKTYWALRTAFQLSAGEAPAGKVEFCTFHAGYGYADFIEGLRPGIIEGHMVYQRKDGVFKEMCAEAEEEPNRNFYLVIDEINRGDVPRIFGELMSVIEKNKRSRDVILPLSKSRFSVPDNVFMIGTMSAIKGANSLLDAVLRRRFAFVEMMPDPSVLGDAAVEGIGLASWLAELNKRIRAHVGRNARSLQIGHSYFLRGEQPIRDFSSLVETLQDDIIPLLEEYCSGDFAVLEKILGPALIDVEELRVRHEMFERPSWGSLSEALRQMVRSSAPAAGKPAKAERNVLAKSTT